MSAEPDHEKALSDFFERYVADGKSGGLQFALRHPLMTVDALRRLHALPATRFTETARPESAHVLRALADRPGWAALRPAVSTLRIPADAAAYTEGASKQTLRRKMRAAQKAGVTWRRIDDPDERFILLRRADAYERERARDRYRNADADNSDLLDVRLWLAAFGADGEPLMLSVTPYDGEWGALRYFRTFSEDPAATDTRYLMSTVLVQHLAVLGVRRLVDTVHPIHLPNGLRHFQRMVGFRLERVRYGATPRRMRVTSPLTFPIGRRARSVSLPVDREASTPSFPVGSGRTVAAPSELVDDRA